MKSSFLPKYERKIVKIVITQTNPFVFPIGILEELLKHYSENLKLKQMSSPRIPAVVKSRNDSDWKSKQLSPI